MFQPPVDLASNIALPPIPVAEFPVCSEQEPTTHRRASKRFTRARRACVPCARAHMSCGEARPCQRCTSRGLADMCKDSPNEKKRGRKKGDKVKKPERSQQSAAAKPKEETEKKVDELPKSLPVPVSLSCVQEFDLAFPLSNIGVPNFAAATDDYLESTLDLPLELSNLWASFVQNEDCIADPMCQTAETPGFKASLARIRKRLEKSLSDQEAETILNIMRMHRLMLKQNLRGIVRKCYPNFEAGKFWQGLYQRDEILDIVRRYVQGSYPFNETPSIVFDRSGVIYYVNQSYRALTCWTLPLPTQRETGSFYDEMSSLGYREWLLSMVSTVTEHMNGKNVSWFMFNTGIRVHTQDRFVEGTLSVTVNWDRFKLPLVYIANFLPK